MKRLWIPTAALAFWLAASPGVAEEKTDAHSQTQASGSAQQTTDANASSETSGSVAAKAERKINKVMFGQITAIQAQLGLHRGGARTDKEMRTSARTQAEALTTEARAVLGADATPREIREFFRARISGYKTTVEMKEDIAAVLGPDPGHGAVKAYLLLRRAEIEGLSGREPDFDALRAEVKATGEMKVGELRGLLREKVRASVGRDDADEEDGEDKDDANPPGHKKPEGSKKEGREEMREARTEARIEAKLLELEANTEARLAKLEARREKTNAGIEAMKEKVQAKAEARKVELETQLQKIQAKAEARQKAEVRVGRDEEEGRK